MILIVAEKPSVGRDIARVLGVSKKGDGFLQSEKYIVSWAIGHLVTLFEPDDYDPDLKRWTLGSLPIIPEEIKIKGIKETKDQLIKLKNLMHLNEVEEIVCATDSGREGELIFRHIYNIVKSKKPVKRLWISSMTDEAIKKGFSMLKDMSDYDFLYQSAKCRQEADWLVGINATRAYTKVYGALLSLGRVQTPTLAILTQRQKEINAFNAKDYWEVKAIFEDYNGIYIDKEDNSKIYKEEDANGIAEKVNGKKGVIASVETDEKRQLPYLLYDLNNLQMDCNRRYGFSAKKTLDIAQQLYEKHKTITYPRTDSRYLSTDMESKLPALVDKLSREPSYTPYTDYIKGLAKLPITKRIIDDTKITDHHAIIPTGYISKGMNADERRVYDQVCKKFLQAFFPPYIYSVTKIITIAENERFLSKGTIIIQLGFMELYQNDNAEKDDKNKDDSQKLPPLVKGQETAVTDVSVLRKKTKPPQQYTEATLLSAMENAGRFIDDEELKEQLKGSGIGTAATRAGIIERLLTVKYIERKGKNIVPTEKGMNIIEIVPKELSSPETTGKWERGLNLIAGGKMEPERFMGSIERYTRYLVQEARTNIRRDIVFKEENSYADKNPGQPAGG
ncbi:DNA topoisomerase [Clostridia bacterium]|nr:DNA topoisomerase [Clostridia bacterium]